MKPSIQISDADGIRYYHAERAGVQYMAYWRGDRWHVHTKRLALGRSNFGSWKFFECVEELAAKVKAFAGLDRLIGAEAMEGSA